MKRVFLTGADGFIGGHLLKHLCTDASPGVTVLSRRNDDVDSAGVRRAANQCSDFRIVRAGLHDVDRYRKALDGVDVVVHLAATTGKTTLEECTKTNVDGTDRLVRAAKEAGVGSFVFVSTIAVNYPVGAEYPYAQTKRAAEEVVRSGGMRHAIVRPTIVLGRNGELWQKLLTLARMPAIPVLGDGRVQIQPIHARDLTLLLGALVDGPLPDRVVLEVGGPERLSMEQFLKRIASATGRKRPRSIHIPIGPIAGALGIAERVAFGLLPVTRGQLSVFRFDSTAAMHPFVDERRKAMLDVDGILADLLP